MLIILLAQESESVYNYAVQSVPHGIAILEDVNTVPTLTFHNDAILKCFRQCEGMMKTDFAQAVESVFSPSDVNQVVKEVVIEPNSLEQGGVWLSRVGFF